MTQLRADHDDASVLVLRIAAGELHDLDEMASWLEPRVIELPS